MLGVPEKQDFQRCMVKTFLFVTKRKARHGVELWLALSYAFPCCPNHVGLNLKNYNHAHEWSKSFSIHVSSSSRVSNLIESPWWWKGGVDRNMFKVHNRDSFVKQKNEFIWLYCLKMCEPNSWISLRWQTLLLTRCLFSSPETSAWTTSVSCPRVLCTASAS